jgi:predicted ATPase
MLTSLEIDSFRGLNGLSFDPLSRINVITGFNNSGKTTILEAIYLLLGTHEQLQNYPNVFRSAQGSQAERFEHFWKWLVPNASSESEASVTAFDDEKRKLRVVLKQHAQQRDTLTIQHMDSSRGTTTMNVTRSGFGAKQERPWPKMEFFSPRMSDPVVDAEQYNKVQLLRDGEERVLDLMRVVEPRLRKLRYAKITNEPLVYADVGLGSLLPSSQMGQAFCRMLTLYMEMLVTEAEVLLIDEIENGLHHSVFESVWKGIGSLSKTHGIQVFVTTHSIECVNAAANAAPSGDPHGFSHHRLETYEDRLVVNTTREMLGRTIPKGL